MVYLYEKKKSDIADKKIKIKVKIHVLAGPDLQKKQTHQQKSVLWAD